ncbi:MAG: M23 family metallopeptidase [Patescibacteria group bacterium]
MVLTYPARKKFISQCFGRECSNDPIFKEFYVLFDFKHPGVDFALPIGTKIQASFPGIIVRMEFHKGMGNVVGTRYGNIIILYAHLSKTTVQLGQIIKSGDLIGLSGNTGSATTEPHLHFEIRDITKNSLKEMVFNPPFEKSIKQLKENFTYIVNNKNTTKTLKSLAKRYFGSERFWKRILEANPQVNLKSNEQIKKNTLITIPNF